MYEEPNGQDTIPTNLNGKIPNESAIFALHACIQRNRDEERNNRKSESSRLCCAARFPEKPVCYGNAASNWNWVNRGCSNQYPYSSNHQSYVRECPVQYYCPTCLSKEKEVVKENCCNKQIETIVTWPCCYCSQLTSEKADKKPNCRNVETQCKCSNEEMIQRSFDGTGDSQAKKIDAVEQSSSETEVLNEVSKESDQKGSRNKPLVKESGEVQAVSSKTSNKKKLDSEESKSTTEQKKKLDKKCTSQSRSQGKLGVDSASTGFRFNEESKDKSFTQNLATKKTEESGMIKGKSKIPKSVSNIDEYASAIKSSKISTSNDKKMKSMIPTPNGRRVVESKGAEPREKSSVRKNPTEVDVKKSYVLSSNSSKRDNVNKNESMYSRRSNGVGGDEKIEKSSRKDLDKLDINKSYVLNSKNNKSNLKKETMGISNNKISQDKSEIKKKLSKNDKINKSKKVKSNESYRDSESVVEEKASNRDNFIDVDINKSYVLYSNNNNDSTTSKIFKPDDLNCDSCCCCRRCGNANDDNSKITEASEYKDLSYSTSEEAERFEEDSDNSSCSCTTCSCSDISEDENKQQQSQILNQKQKKSNVEIINKQACKRKVEFAKKEQINKIYSEKGKLFDPSIQIKDENTLQDLTRKKSALQSSSKQAAEFPTCPCCGTKLDGILEFSTNKTKQSTVSRESNVAQPSLQKVGNNSTKNNSQRVINSKTERTNKNIQRKNLGVDTSTQNNLDNIVNQLNCLCKEKVSMNKPCFCPNVTENALNQNQLSDNNEISSSSTSNSISSATNSNQVENCNCKKQIPCVNNENKGNNNNNGKSRSGNMRDESKIAYRNRNTTVSRSTEVDVGPDTIQQARQRSMNTYVCAEDIETTHRIYCK